MNSFSRLFTLPHGLYVEGSPVMILAGALLKEYPSGRVLLQLKFQNVTEKIVKDITIKVRACDAEGKSIKDAVTFTYEKIQLHPYAESGDKIPIFLPETAKSFDVEILAVTYADGKVFQPESPADMQPVTEDTLKNIEAKKARTQQGINTLVKVTRPALIAAAVISVICITLSIFAWADYYRFHEYIPRYIIALIPVVLCLLVALGMNRFPVIIKIAAVAAIVLLVLKLVLYQVAPLNLDCYAFIPRWVNCANVIPLKNFDFATELRQAWSEFRNAGEWDGIVYDIITDQTTKLTGTAFLLEKWHRCIYAWHDLLRKIDPITALVPEVLTSVVLVIASIYYSIKKKKRIH